MRQARLLCAPWPPPPRLRTALLRSMGSQQQHAAARAAAAPAPPALPAAAPDAQPSAASPPPPPPSAPTSTQPLEGLERTLHALDTPPPAELLGSRVEHLIVDEEGRALDVLCRLLGLPQWFVERLISFGAVYYAPVLPRPRHSECLPPGFNERWEAARKPALERWGHKSQLQTVQRLCSGDTAVHVGGYLRCHLHPKRFPVVHSIPDWRARIIEHTEHYVAVDKPAGVQVPPTVCNIQESLLACVERALGLASGSVTPPHRLDVGTQGCVVLARSREFARYFQGLLAHKEGPGGHDRAPAEGEVAPPCELPGPEQPGPEQQQQQQQQQAQQPRMRKTYRCVSLRPPFLGRMGHWAEQECREVGGPAHTRPVLPGQPVPSHAKWCELEVLEVREVALSQAAADSWGVQTAFESTLRLVTGRTHQIRAQFAACGHPLLGDSMYTALSHCWHGSAPQGSTTGSAPPGTAPAAGHQGSGTREANSAQGVQGVRADWARAAQANPLQPLGLQAWRLEVLEDAEGYFGRAPPIVLQAGAAWWQDPRATV